MRCVCSGMGGPPGMMMGGPPGMMMGGPPGMMMGGPPGKIFFSRMVLHLSLFLMTFYS